MRCNKIWFRLTILLRPEAKNLHITITFQLHKGSFKQRYYTQENIGIAKNIVDTASTCIMIRDLLDDEYTGEKRELKVYKLEERMEEQNFQLS